MIVIISCGRQGFVDDAIRCARSQTVDCRVVVVENGAGIGASHGADVVLWSAPDVSDARNVGLRYAGSEPVALWDDDDWYGPRYLDESLALGDVVAGRPGFVHDMATGEMLAIDVAEWRELPATAFGGRIVLRDASLSVPFVSRGNVPGEDGEWFRAMGGRVVTASPFGYVYRRHANTLFRDDVRLLARHSCIRLPEPDHRFATGERPIEGEPLPVGDEYRWSVVAALREQN